MFMFMFMAAVVAAAAAAELAAEAADVAAALSEAGGKPVRCGAVHACVFAVCTDTRLRRWDVVPATSLVFVLKYRSDSTAYHTAVEVSHKTIPLQTKKIRHAPE